MKFARRQIKLVFATMWMCFFVGFAFSASALEADQYRIWKAGLNQIDDSTQVTNDFLNDQMQEFLAKKANTKKQWKNSESCYEVAHKYMRYIRPSFFKDNLKNLLIDLPNGALPKKQKLFYDYKNSIFKGFAWPPLMPVAQTVKLNGVYLGTDKVDHFFASGRRYLNAYQRALKKGASTREAVIRSLQYGVSWAEETGVLGEWSAGSFSFADLEANYQGLELARDLCEGENSILKFSQTEGWQQRRNLHIEDYVSPLWDESFNNSAYSKSRWKKVKRNLSLEYCELGQDPKIQKLWKDYQKRLDAKPNDFHLEYIRGMILSRQIPDPTQQTLHKACNYPKGVMEGPKVWHVPNGYFEK